MQKKGNKYGTHRVIEPKGVLPQPANKIDNNMDEIWDNEILIDVQTLNVDSASFTDIKARAGGDHEKIKEIMFDIVAKQGKHRNPWTGSGGMLLGTVEKIGDALKGKINLKEGDKILFLDEGNGRIYFENTALLAFNRIQDEMKDEAEKAGFNDEQELQDFAREIRQEMWEKNYANNA